MSWFSQSATIEPEPETPPVNPAQERLEQVEAELPLVKAACIEARKLVRECRAHVKDPRITFLPDGLYTAVGAMNMQTPHAALEALQRKADERLDNSLAERGALMLSLKLIR